MKIKLFLVSGALLHFFFLFKSCWNKSVEGIEEVPDVMSNNSLLLDSCIQVSQALSYYENQLERYNYDEKKCSPFKKIGNYVMEKNHLNEKNCYSKIQKPICRLMYFDREVETKRKEVEKKKKKNFFSKEECEKTKMLFLVLMKKCVEQKEDVEDSSFHCASFDYRRKIIKDPEVFCTSSFYRKEVQDDFPPTQQSIYGNSFVHKFIKTFSFKKEEINDCINISNNFNNCSVIGQAVFKDSIESCLSSSNSDDITGREGDSSSGTSTSNSSSAHLHYCKTKIEKASKMNYIYDCADILLPYLLSFKNEKNSYKELCYGIKNYFFFLKKEKLSYSKKKSKLKEEIKNKNFFFRLSRAVESLFTDLKEHMESSYACVTNLLDTFSDIKLLKKIYILQDEEYKQQLYTLDELIYKLYNVITDMEYPSFDEKTKQQNIDSFYKIKSQINEINNIIEEIFTVSQSLNKFVDKKKKLHSDVNFHLNEEKFEHLNMEHLLTLKEKYKKTKNVINQFALKNQDSTIAYYKAQERDYMKQIKQLEQLIDVNSDQIGLLIKKNVII